MSRLGDDAVEVSVGDLVEVGATDFYSSSAHIGKLVFIQPTSGHTVGMTKEQALDLAGALREATQELEVGGPNGD
jgi:hypothetical protein